jgi:hypothetical protein
MLPYIQALNIGAVISRPGARVQRFHCDATHAMFAAAQADPSHRIYNVFIPLVDLCEDGDGTEFWVAPSLQVLSLLLSLLDGTKGPILTPEELLFLTGEHPRSSKAFSALCYTAGTFVPVKQSTFCTRK